MRSTDYGFGFSIEHLLVAEGRRTANERTRHHLHLFDIPAGDARKFFDTEGGEVKLAIAWLMVWSALLAAWLYVMGLLADATRVHPQAGDIYLGFLWGVVAAYLYRQIVNCIDILSREAAKRRNEALHRK